MGIFSSKKKTYVASSVYNLAGDINLRPNFLRTVLVGSALTNNSKTSIASTLTQAMLGGAGMNQRRFFRWARDNYGIGMPKAVINGSSSVDTAVVASGMTSALALPAGTSLRIISASVDSVDVEYWVRPWILQNHPELADDAWSADWDPVAMEITIEMLIADVPVSASIPAPADFVWGMDQALGSRDVLFVIYQLIVEDPGTELVTLTLPELFTYRMGSGNVVFDTLVRVPVFKTQFFPALPLRLDNKSIRHVDLEDTYADVKKAFKKLTHSGVDELLDQIEENDKIDDIDFCFMVSGVSLNSKENEAKRYLYKFFEGLISEQKTTKTSFEAYRASDVNAKKNTIQWSRWLKNNDSLISSIPGRESLVGAAAPLLAPKGVTPPVFSELRVYAENLPSFDHRLRWIYIDETLHQGNGKTFDSILTRGKMKVGDFWIHVAPDVQMPSLEYQSERDSGMFTATMAGTKYSKILLFHQRSKFGYARLEIVGMEHVNLVYNNKSVTITAREAMEEEDGEESGFLVPLHYPTLSSMGMLRSTQLATSSSYLVFNSYKVVKIKWYQRGFFRILMVIAMAVLSVVFPPLGGMAASGLLGANLAVGMAMGFTSAVAAAIAGAVANALVSMLLSTLIQQGAVEIFGEKFGAIIGTLVTFVAMNYAKQFAMSGNFNVDWGSIFRVDSLMKLTNSVTGAYNAWLHVDTAGIYEDIAGLEDKYKSQFQKVKDASDEMLGTTAGVIDPMMLTDTLEYSSESSAEFYSRTTMTGDQIAELSQALIYDFAEISLELPKLQA